MAATSHIISSLFSETYTIRMMYGNGKVASFTIGWKGIYNIVITWVMLFLWACDLLPNWWYTLMAMIGGNYL